MGRSVETLSNKEAMVIRETHLLRWAAMSLGMEPPGEMPSMIGIPCPAKQQQRMVFEVIMDCTET